MKISILGGNGFLGTHLARRLSADDHQIVLLSRNPAWCKGRVLPRGVVQKKYAPYVQERLAEVLAGSDVVINLVGILNESGRKGDGFTRAHVELTENALAACERVGCSRFIHISALNAGVGESHYLRSKGEAERLVLDAPRIEATLFAPSVMFGFDDLFFNRFAMLLGLFPIFPLACSQSRMAPVWVDDVAAAIAQSVSDPATFGQRYELCGPEVFSLGELVERVNVLAGLRRRVIALPAIAGRIQGWIFDWLPIKLFSSDNYRSLQVDSVCTKDGLDRLGISPTAIDAVLPRYLGPRVRAHNYQSYRERHR